MGWVNTINSQAFVTLTHLLLTLAQALRSSETGNLVFSPFGLGLLLVMARLGAKGKTATEMDKAFYFPPDEKVLLDGYEKAMQTFQVRLGDWNDQGSIEGT